MQHGERLHDSNFGCPTRVLEPPEQSTDLHREIGARGQGHVEFRADAPITLKTSEPFRQRPRGFGNDRSVPTRPSAFPTEGHAIGFGMPLCEMDGGSDRSPCLLCRVAPDLTNRRQPGRPKTRQCAQLDLAKQGVFVGEMGIEGADSHAGSTGDRIAVDALRAFLCEEPEAGREQFRFGILQSGPRHGFKFTDLLIINIPFDRIDRFNLEASFID
jgi:hypothetical protein